jgi:hypothetical protein
MKKSEKTTDLDKTEAFLKQNKIKFSRGSFSGITPSITIEFDDDGMCWSKDKRTPQQRLKQAFANVDALLKNGPGRTKAPARRSRKKVCKSSSKR